MIKTERPDVLINPVGHATPQAVYEWLERFFNPITFTLEIPFPPKLLQSGKVGRIDMSGYQVALLFGKTDVIQDAAWNIRFGDGWLGPVNRLPSDRTTVEYPPSDGFYAGPPGGLPQRYETAKLSVSVSAVYQTTNYRGAPWCTFPQNYPALFTLIDCLL